MITKITSKDNKIYKQAKKLLGKSERYKTGLFLAEGKRIVSDAVSSKAAEYIFVSEDFSGEDFGLPTYVLNNSMFSELSDTKTSQGIIAVCRMNFADINCISGDLILVCDGVSDPGNLGTLIRTAECSGADGVIILKGSVDPFSPKVVRSTMGSVFRIPMYFIDGGVKEYLDEYKIAVTVLDGSKNLYECDLSGKIAVVVGNEAYGVGYELVKCSDIKIKIPMSGNAESLNVSVAGSVVMYEAYRQKHINTKGKSGE